MDDVVAEANKKGDTQVFRFDFQPQTGDLGYGASWHPSYWQQIYSTEMIYLLTCDT